VLEVETFVEEDLGADEDVGAGGDVSVEEDVDEKTVEELGVSAMEDVVINIGPTSHGHHHHGCDEGLEANVNELLIEKVRVMVVMKGEESCVEEEIGVEVAEVFRNGVDETPLEFGVDVAEVFRIDVDKTPLDEVLIVKEEDCCIDVLER
jgi:hypothetical protein